VKQQELRASLKYRHSSSYSYWLQNLQQVCCRFHHDTFDSGIICRNVCVMIFTLFVFVSKLFNTSTYHEPWYEHHL